MKYLDYQFDRIQFNGLDLSSRLAGIPTPSFLYFPERFKDNLRQIDQNLSKLKIQAFYAYKANYYQSLIPEIIRTGSGVEVMSGQELNSVLKLGFNASRIIFNGVGRSSSALEQAIRLGVDAIVADNPAELDLIAGISKKLSRETSVFFRFYPFWESKIIPRSFIPKFYKLGIQDQDELAAMLSIIGKNPLLKLRGLSFHIAVKALTSSLHYESLILIYQTFLELKKQQPFLDTISIGGGFESRYLLERQGMDITTLLKPVSEFIRGKSEIRRLIIEPGRYLVNDCFLGLASVLNVKKNFPGIWYLLDLGTNVLVPRPNAYFEIYPLRWKKGPLYTSSFGDGLCSSNSVIARNLYLPELQSGDQVLIANCGAYTMNQGSNFGYPLPEIQEIC
ncbi:MAG: hypothetical protein PHW04_06160 [Candidatus Wallbacteria bacterium]|nr:hypothetical protein [Candidatus Wallbacteria bacterium]